jgi:hypothetical protein
VDEDCFITDWSVVLKLVDYVKENGISHAGMPDGSVHPLRSNSWAVHNPFFNVFDVKACNEIVSKHTKKYINTFTFDKIKKQTPPIENGICDHNNDEPFTGIFYYLHAKGKPLNLSIYVWADEITTEILFNEQPLCVHTWYSRDYNFDDNVKNRIDAIYENCKDRVLGG